MTPEQNNSIIVRQDQEAINQSIQQTGSPSLHSFTPSFGPPIASKEAEAVYRLLTNPTIPVPDRYNYDRHKEIL